MARLSGVHVRLRSRSRGTYLHADENGVSVSLSAERASLRTVWRMESVRLRHLRVPGHYVSLQGAAYGRYLAVLPEDDQHGHGHLLRQHIFYGEKNNVNALWMVLKVWGGAENEVRMRHSRFMASHIGVAVPNPDDLSTRWVVEMVAWTPHPPVLPNPHLGLLLPFATRAIIYARSEDGMSASTFWRRIDFPGRSVHNLRAELARCLGEANPLNITMYIWTGYNIPRIPLVHDLPLSTDTMVIGILRTRSPAAMRLQHPNVDAPEPLPARCPRLAVPRS